MTTGCRVRRVRWLVLAPIVLCLALFAGVPAAAAQEFRDTRARVEFQRAADAYVFLHRQVERRLGQAHRKAGLPDAIDVRELAEAIRAERRGADAGAIFTPVVAAAFRDALARAVGAGCDGGELRTGPWEERAVNAGAAGTKPLAACLLRALPALPDELEYRGAGAVLVLVDTHADLIVDVLPAALSGASIVRE